MCLSVSLVIFKVVDIVIISRTIHFHSLQECHEFAEVWLSVDAENICELHRASLYIAETHH